MRVIMHPWVTLREDESVEWPVKLDDYFHKVFLTLHIKVDNFWHIGLWKGPRLFRVDMGWLVIYGYGSYGVVVNFFMMLLMVYVRWTFMLDIVQGRLLVGGRLKLMRTVVRLKRHCMLWSRLVRHINLWLGGVENGTRKALMRQLRMPMFYWPWLRAMVLHLNELLWLADIARLSSMLVDNIRWGVI